MNLFLSRQLLERESMVAWRRRSISMHSLMDGCIGNQVSVLPFTLYPLSSPIRFDCDLVKGIGRFERVKRMEG